MRKLILWSQSHPWLVVVILLSCSILSFLYIKDIRIDTSSKVMMIEGDPAQAYYYETLEKFGSDSIATIYVWDSELFTPEKLQYLEELAYTLEGMPGVNKVESLFSVNNIKNVDGYLHSGPLMDRVPETAEEARQVQNDALRIMILRRNLISDNGTSTAINLYLDPKSEDSDFMLEVGNRIEEILVSYTSKFGTLFQIGSPFNLKTQAEILSSNQKTLIPLAAGVILLILVVSMRSLSGAVLPVLTAGMSILWTLGFMGYTGIPVTVLTFIVPSLLIVIGSTEDIHLLSEYLEGMHEKGLREKAIRHMATKMGTAVMLTAVTTVFAFLSISINEIIVLRQFGITASFGLFVNAFITILLLPVYLRYFGPLWRGGCTKTIVDRLLINLTDKILEIIHSRKWVVLAILLGTASIVGLFGLRVRVDNNMLGWFKKDSSLIKRVQTIQASLSGTGTFFIRIGGDPGDFQIPENLVRIEALQEYIRQQAWCDKNITLTDYIKLIHREMNGGDPKYFRIPDSANTICEYLLFLHREEIESYVTPMFDELNILVRHSIYSSRELNAVLQILEQKAKEIVPSRFDVGFTGEGILINKAVDSIAAGQAQSIGLVSLVIFFAMTILFMNLKVGFLSLVPNLIPVALNFGIMGIFNIPLNTGTCMVAPIAIGIAVDDTVHLMVRYHREMRDLQDQHKCLGSCIRYEIRPVLCTSVALALGFGVLAFSEFIPIICFGVLSALVMIFALIADMLVTPILLSSRISAFVPPKR